MIPKVQTALVQYTSTASTKSESYIPLSIAHLVPVPEIPSPHHVLVRVLAVGMNPTDVKMVTRFNTPGNASGCDFCGIVELAGSSVSLSVGTRVCGADFPYGYHSHQHNGAFSQWVVADARYMLRVPNLWTDTQAAALGAVGWGTACMAMSDPEALGLTGLPSKPVDKQTPVLVYGGGTSTGIIAIQILKRSGYLPIAICSSRSAPLAMQLGALGTASYTSESCVEAVKSMAALTPIRHALDCITDSDSASMCFESLGRTGGRYVCLEEFHHSWHTRRAVKVKVVMGYEMAGIDVDLGSNIYTRKANPELHVIGMVWVKEIQALLDAGVITTLPVRELHGGFEGIIEGLSLLKAGDVRGEKLVVRVSE